LPLASVKEGVTTLFLKNKKLLLMPIKRHEMSKITCRKEQKTLIKFFIKFITYITVCDVIYVIADLYWAASSLSALPLISV
jgi:hypothetical protein